MKNLWKIIKLLLLLTFSHSSATLWNAEDALILEVDGAVQVNETSSEEVVSTTIGVGGDDEGVCVTNEGVQGTCIKFTECYPYFKNEIKDTKHSTVSSHIEMVKNMSTPCQPMDEPTVNPLSPGGEGLSEDDHICCATLSRAVDKGVSFPNFPHFPHLGKPPTVDKMKMKPGEVSSTEATPTISPQCGVTPYTNEKVKVVMGREAKVGEFPWAVAMFYNGRHHCGASLIDSRHVVTAAHCVNTIRTGAMLQNLRLYIGAHDIYGKDYQVRKVKKLAFHKGFNGQQFRDDIALMVLDTPVKMSSKVKPICLHPGGPAYDNGETNADIAGWGKISEHGPPSRRLRTANIRIWTNAQCGQKYRGTQAPPISAGMVCAGTNGMDSCQGDSGGPLTLNRSGKEFLIGIVSWGIKCGVYPGVYTRADKYVSWIEKYKTKLNY